MKKKVKVIQKGKVVEKEIEHIPFRFIIAMFLILFKTLTKCKINYIFQVTEND